MTVSRLQLQYTTPMNTKARNPKRPAMYCLRMFVRAADRTKHLGTQIRFAALIGVSATTISHAERVQGRLSPALRRLLVEKLGISATWLLTRQLPGTPIPMAREGVLTHSMVEELFLQQDGPLQIPAPGAPQRSVQGTITLGKCLRYVELLGISFRLSRKERREKQRLQRLWAADPPAPSNPYDILRTPLTLDEMLRYHFYADRESRSEPASALSQAEKVDYALIVKKWDAARPEFRLMTLKRNAIDGFLLVKLRAGQSLSQRERHEFYRGKLPAAKAAAPVPVDKTLKGLIAMSPRECERYAAYAKRLAADDALTSEEEFDYRLLKRLWDADPPVPAMPKPAPPVKVPTPPAPPVKIPAPPPGPKPPESLPPAPMDEYTRFKTYNDKAAAGQPLTDIEMVDYLELMDHVGRLEGPPPPPPLPKPASAPASKPVPPPPIISGITLDSSWPRVQPKPDAILAAQLAEQLAFVTSCFVGTDDRVWRLDKGKWTHVTPQELLTELNRVRAIVGAHLQH